MGKEREIKTYKLRTNGFRTDILQDTDSRDIDGLEPAIHRCTDDDEGIYFKRKDGLYLMSEKIYGTNIQERSKMVLDDYIETDKPLGAMIVGSKGNGKSMLAEYIANKAITELNIPVLEVKSMIRAKSLESMIRAAGDCIVFIDEYSKYYSPRFANTTGGSQDTDNSDELLTLFSDKTLGKVLFIITDNKMQNISEFLHNRTGRMLYRFMYDYVQKDVVIDICKDHGVEQEITDFLVDHAKNTKESIDNILTLAKKATKYKTISSFQSIFSSLNVRPPMFRSYYIKTDTPERLKVRVEGEDIVFTVRSDEEKKDSDGTIIATAGDNISRFKISTMNYRNRRGTVHGVNYIFAFNNKPEKPEDIYDAPVVPVPPAEFANRSYFF